MKIAIVANSAWYIANFRLNLGRALQQSAHEVIAISPGGSDVAHISEAGIRHVPFELSGRGTNPFRELGSVLALRRSLKSQGIDLCLSFTPKGNIYTAIARLGTEVRQVANVSGLGSSFLQQGWLATVVRTLYRLTFHRMSWVFFQNDDDRCIFLNDRLVAPDRCERIPGSGVDLQHFGQCPLPAGEPGRRIFLMVARLLGDKGVREYVQAARQIQATHPDARFQLLGSATADNPSAIHEDELNQWTRAGWVEYLGHHADVRPYLAAAHCIVLPSYREGVPRTLLEGGAIGRPLVATDVPGCRDPVAPNHNGWLCAARSADSLAAAMTTALLLPDEQLREMGRHSRQKIEAEFSEHLVIDHYLKVIKSMDNQKPKQITPVSPTR